MDGWISASLNDILHIKWGLVKLKIKIEVGDLRIEQAEDSLSIS